MKTEPSARFPRTSAAVAEFHYLEYTESTNSVMAAGDSWPPFAMVITEDQTAGRGRLGRTWINRPGESVAFSMLVPPLARLSPTWVPLLAGACLVQALRDAGLGGVGLKWPNDVLVEDKKLAGVLCEMHLPGGVIVGVGLNRHFAGERPSEDAIALAECMPGDDAAVDAIMAGFVERLRRWQTSDQTSDQTSGVAEAHAYVSEALVSAKRAVEVVPVAGASWRGVAQGLNVNGHLIVRTREGVDIEIVSADVHHLYQ